MLRKEAYYFNRHLLLSTTFKEFWKLKHKPVIVPALSGLMVNWEHVHKYSVAYSVVRIVTLISAVG